MAQEGATFIMRLWFPRHRPARPSVLEMCRMYVKVLAARCGAFGLGTLYASAPS
jgi:hypothetical protein